MHGFSPSIQKARTFPYVRPRWVQSELILTIWSEFPSWAEAFWWLTLARGGVDDEHAFILGGVDVGELPEHPMPLTVCWYIIESPAFRINNKERNENNEILLCVCTRDSIHFLRSWCLCAKWFENIFRIAVKSFSIRIEWKWNALCVSFFFSFLTNFRIVKSLRTILELLYNRQFNFLF